MDVATQLTQEFLQTVPRWVTPDLVRETGELFQRRYERALTPEEVLEIIVGVGQFVDVMKQVDLDETIRRTGESEQP